MAARGLTSATKAGISYRKLAQRVDWTTAERHDATRSDACASGMLPNVEVIEGPTLQLLPCSAASEGSVKTSMEGAVSA